MQKVRSVGFCTRSVWMLETVPLSRFAKLELEDTAIPSQSFGHEIQSRGMLNGNSA